MIPLNIMPHYNTVTVSYYESIIYTNILNHCYIMWFLVYWYNKQLCNLKCLISLDASTIWQFGKDETGNLV